MTEQGGIPIKFGTDGWRAPIADEFTVANVRVCAQALCDLMIEDGTASKGLMVAYDTRFGSEMFAHQVSDVALGNGIAVKLTAAVTPTPTARRPLQATSGPSRAAGPTSPTSRLPFAAYIWTCACTPTTRTMTCCASSASSSTN